MEIELESQVDSLVIGSAELEGLGRGAAGPQFSIMKGI